MNTIFKGMVGAAALVAASAVSVSAQDYTWTLQNFNFGDYSDGTTFENLGTETGSTATGTLVMTKIEGGYALKSYNFSTFSDTGFGINAFGGTGFAATYDSSNFSLFGTDFSPEFDTFVEVAGESTDGSGTEFRFRLSWDNGALADEMNGNFGAGNLGAVISLDGINTYEYDLDGSFVRYNDDTNAFNNTARDTFPGQLVLTGIPAPVTTPEPASLALLGTGLLGIFAARRRKAS